MTDPPIKRQVTLISACMHHDGYPDFALNQVDVDDDEYVNGVHYLLVERLLAAAGYEEPYVHFSEAESPAFLIPAVRKHLGIDTPEAALSETFRAAEESVNYLIQACRKSRPLYHHNPKVTAQVTRTAKWLLNAIAAPNKSLDTSTEECKADR